MASQTSSQPSAMQFDSSSFQSSKPPEAQTTGFREFCKRIFLYALGCSKILHDVALK